MGREKNATGSLAWVNHNDNSNEPTARRSERQEAVDRDGRLHHHTMEAMTISSGQTR